MAGLRGLCRLLELIWQSLLSAPALFYLCFIISIPPSLGETISEQVSSPSRSKPLIMIDPGHGGEDRGAAGSRQLVEKDVVLDVAVRVATLLKEGQRFDVALTRDSDTQVPLSERTRMANDKSAALFVSLHTNASQSRAPRGLTTYYLDNSDDAASRLLAERENSSLQSKSDSDQGDLAVLLSSLIQSGKMEESIVLAHTIHEGADETLRWHRALPASPSLRKERYIYFQL
jgi:N-acetylmuramoyl-L-alanine amidase